LGADLADGVTFGGEAAFGVVVEASLGVDSVHAGFESFLALGVILLGVVVVGVVVAIFAALFGGRPLFLFFAGVVLTDVSKLSSPSLPFKFKFKNFIVQLKIHLNGNFPFATLE
jgi:hypothetical protein